MLKVTRGDPLSCVSVVADGVDVECDLSAVPPDRSPRARARAPAPGPAPGPARVSDD